MPYDVDRQTIRLIAATLPCDERSVRKELTAPGSVRGIAGERIRQALAEWGAARSASSASERP